MKAIFMIICLGMVSVSYAVETSTDCPMMNEKNERTNPKQNMNFKPKENTKKNTVSAQ